MTPPAKERLDRDARLAIAVEEAFPYVYNVATDPTNDPWRRETAQRIADDMREALRRDKP